MRSPPGFPIFFRKYMFFMSFMRHSLAFLGSARFAVAAMAVAAVCPLRAQVHYPEDIETARRVREQLLADPYRPVFHFAIPEGVSDPASFDPNGAIYWKGRYHLCYLFMENGRKDYSWGHLSSIDMVHWRLHPPIHLDGGLSGNAIVNKEGEVTYSFGMPLKGLGLAVSSDLLLDQWRNLPQNPVVSQQKMKDNGSWDAVTPFDAWDPFLWREDDSYFMISGGFPSSPKKPTPPALFTSDNLTYWRFVGPFLAKQMPDVAENEDISCPDFFSLGGKQVLLCISHKRGCRYYVGEWKDQQFHPELHRRMSWSQPPQFFAPETLLTPDGRRVLWVWIRPTLPDDQRRKAGWSGVLSLPRELWLGDDNTLRMKPIEELKQLRYGERQIEPVVLEPGVEKTLEGISGRELELDIEMDPGKTTKTGVKLCRSPDGEEETMIYYDSAKKELVVDTTRSGLKCTQSEAAPLDLRPGEFLKLRVFLDRSVLEVFANERQAVVRRIYPTREDSTRLTAFAEGGAARLLSFRAWNMFPGNPY